MRTHFLLVLALVGAVALAGCTGAAKCAGDNSSSGQMGVCNEKDAFYYGKNSAMQSGTESFTWENTKTKAKVEWGGNVGDGSVSVQVKDAAGKVVFSKTYSGVGQDGGSTTTQAGVAGDWRITVTFSKFTGQVGLGLTAA